MTPQRLTGEGRPGSRRRARRPSASRRASRSSHQSSPSTPGGTAQRLDPRDAPDGVGVRRSASARKALARRVAPAADRDRGSVRQVAAATVRPAGASDSRRAARPARGPGQAQAAPRAARPAAICAGFLSSSASVRARSARRTSSAGSSSAPGPGRRRGHLDGPVQPRRPGRRPTSSRQNPDTSLVAGQGAEAAGVTAPDPNSETDEPERRRPSSRATHRRVRSQRPVRGQGGCFASKATRSSPGAIVAAAGEVGLGLSNGRAGEDGGPG